VRRRKAVTPDARRAFTTLVREYPSVVTAMIVGSEVMLRGEMSESDLRETIRSVKARVDIPVSYADVWEFWLRYQDISADVDFVTIHILPYWEDLPVRAEDAADYMDAVRRRVVVTFPGKEILIGEVGWPSRGRMREGALPSRVNQARFISEILDRARKEHFQVNLFKAYDEPWKRQWEGTVGGRWGLFDGWSREVKYPAWDRRREQLPILETAVGIWTSSELFGFRSGLSGAVASAINARTGIVGRCGDIRYRWRDSAGRER
jgi:exo-beta-1,3-glucanase (GH17 family)